MRITCTETSEVELMLEAVRHTRLDIEDFLENGALAETEPEYQNELAFYRELRDKHDRLADLEIELNKIVKHGNVEETSAADQSSSEQPHQ